VADEDVVLNRYPFADKGMTRDLAPFSDAGALLDFDEYSDLRFIADFAPVKVDEPCELHTSSQFDIRSYTQIRIGDSIDRSWVHTLLP
jgi:hypothetical protein